MATAVASIHSRTCTHCHVSTMMMPNGRITTVAAVCVSARRVGRSAVAGGPHSGNHRRDNGPRESRQGDALPRPADIRHQLVVRGVDDHRNHARIGGWCARWGARH